LKTYRCGYTSGKIFFAIDLFFLGPFVFHLLLFLLDREFPLGHDRSPHSLLLLGLHLSLLLCG
jgi:hypothetical protein